MSSICIIFIWSTKINHFQNICIFTVRLFHERKPFIFDSSLASSTSAWCSRSHLPWLCFDVPRDSASTCSNDPRNYAVPWAIHKSTCQLWNMVAPVTCHVSCSLEQLGPQPGRTSKDLRWLPCWQLVLWPGRWQLSQRSCPRFFFLKIVTVGKLSSMVVDLN